MPKVTVLMLALLLALPLKLGCSPDQDVEARAPEDSVTVFLDVRVVPMDRARVLEHQTVLVRNGLITELGPSGTIEVPPEARLIDGRGRYLLPGLTDFHVHLRSTDELRSYLTYGVTTVVHMSGAMPGAPDLLRYREELARGERLGPTLFTTGPILDGDPPIFPGVSVVVTTPRAARQAVAEQKRAGYDFIKVYNNLTPEVLAAVAEAAEAQGMAVVGHVPRKAGRARALQQALGAGQDLIAHGEEYFFTYFYRDVDRLLDQGRVPYPDETRIPEAVRLTREAGAAVTPNLAFVAMTRKQLDSLEAVLADPETRYLHPEVLEMWRAQNPTRRADLERFDRREQAKYAFLKRLTKALHEAGVPLLVGTDASAAGVFPGRSAHLELQELVAAGLTPYEALAAATRNPGTFVDEHVPSAEPFGTIAPGQQANLVLVQENPLEDIHQTRSIHGVMILGRWLTRAELEQLREETAGSYDR